MFIYATLYASMLDWPQWLWDIIEVAVPIISYGVEG